VSTATGARTEPGAVAPAATGGWALLRRLFLPVSMVILATAGATIPLPYFIERPGPARPLAGTAADEPLVEVAAEDLAEPLSGSYLLLLVNQLRATPFALLYDLVDGDSIRVPAQAVVPPGVEQGIYFDAQRQEFATTAEIAAAVGLRLAGLEVPLGKGVRVVDVVEGSAAADGELAAEDVLVAAEGSTISTVTALQDAIAEAGTEPVSFTVRRGEGLREVTLTPQEGPEGRPIIGITAETVPFDEPLPVDVTVDGGRVGGPSGGLMIALSVYDLVADDDLAAGREIAGTGTIDADGEVGPIGGIELKVLAASAAGADVFLAPQQQGEAARGAVPEGSDLQVVEVATAEQAVRALSGAAPDSG